jgi:hypothetical protein
MYSPPSLPPLCVAKRGNCLLYSEIAPPLYEVERGLGGEFMNLLSLPQIFINALQPDRDTCSFYGTLCNN